jgi:hypothetical protein
MASSLDAGSCTQDSLFRHLCGNDLLHLTGWATAIIDPDALAKPEFSLWRFALQGAKGKNYRYL